MHALTVWTFHALVAFAPPAHHPQYPGYEETEAEAFSRYEQVAESISEAALERSEKNGDAKARAALLVAWAVGESGVTRDAHLGPCYRGADKHSPLRLRCDGGHAAGVYQLHPLFWHGEERGLSDFFGDQLLGSRIVLRLAEGSLKLCSKLGPRDRFSALGLGRCEEGNKSVRERYDLFLRVRSWNPPKEER